MINLKEGQLFVDITNKHVEGKMTELELMQSIALLESIAMHDYNVAPDPLEGKKHAAALIAIMNS